MNKARFNEIGRLEELRRIYEDSYSNPVIILKHSATCPISHEVYRSVSAVDADFSLIVVQNARSVSDAVEEMTGIRHESPQALVISGGECVYHASHFGIEPSELEKYSGS